MKCMTSEDLIGSLRKMPVQERQKTAWCVTESWRPMQRLRGQLFAVADLNAFKRQREAVKG